MQFDNDIPITPKVSSRTWDFRAMAVGQSFFVPTGTPDNQWASDRARAAMNVANSRAHGSMRWEYRCVEDGIRIWRMI